MSKLHRHLITSVFTALDAIMHEGQSAEVVVGRALLAHQKWGSRDRRQFAEHVYELVRHWRWAGHLADSEETEAKWAAWWMLTNAQSLPEEFAAGLNFETVQARATLPVSLAVRESLPDWLEAKGAAAYGEAWPAMARNLNAPADVFLRVNRLRAGLPQTAARLLEEGIETEPVEGAPDALRLKVRRPLQQSATFRTGWCEIQDAGSQQIAPFLKISPGQCVVDACAGAGGKTLHLAALMRNQGRLVAMDVHASKLSELETRARRNGVLICETQPISPETLAKWTSQADRVLLDVPCSGLGVLRRKADTKWRLTESTLAELETLQARILREYSPMVKPGGKLVYATCSILPQENEQQVQAFLQEQAGAWELEDQRWIRPGDQGWDGFYMARLVRKK